MARRLAGEGSIYEVTVGGRKVWRGALTVGYGPDGRLKRRYFQGTKAEVASRLDAARQRSGAANLPSGHRLTVGEYMDLWFAQHSANLRPSTRATYGSYIEHHIKPKLGPVRLQKLGPQHIATFLGDSLNSGRLDRPGQDVKGNPLSPRTVKQIRAILRSALSEAVRWEVLERNPAALVTAPRVKRQERPALSPAQAVRLLDESRGHRDQPIWTVALTTGLRQGEILGLEWRDIDFGASTIRVRQQVQRVARETIVGEPKSERGLRTLPAPPLTMEALRDVRSAQRLERLQAGPEWQRSGFVFTTPFGAPRNGPGVTHRLQHELARLGLPAIRFHDLRHTAASFLVAMGVDARMVMEVMGHSSITITMDLYAHVQADRLRVAADAMEEVFKLGRQANDAAL